MSSCTLTHIVRNKFKLIIYLAEARPKHKPKLNETMHTNVGISKKINRLLEMKLSNSKQTNTHKTEPRVT